jgi:hypothetical protein
MQDDRMVDFDVAAIFVARVNKPDKRRHFEDFNNNTSTRTPHGRTCMYMYSDSKCLILWT